MFTITQRKIRGTHRSVDKDFPCFGASRRVLWYSSTNVSQQLTASPSNGPSGHRQQRNQKLSSLHGVISRASADALCLISLCLKLPLAKQGQNEKSGEGKAGGGGGGHDDDDDGDDEDDDDNCNNNNNNNNNNGLEHRN